MITVIGKYATLDEIAKVEPQPAKGAGKRWRPVPHIDLVHAVKDEVKARGWRVAKELYAWGNTRKAGNKGSELCGALMFEHVDGLPGLPGMQFALGFLNNNARRRALKLSVGAHVLCCQNGMCTGEILLRKAHDHSVDIYEEIELALDRYQQSASGIPKMVAGLRNRVLTPAEADHAILEAGRTELVPWATCGWVDKEYRNPTFAEHGKGTSWALLNAFTYAARLTVNPVHQMDVYNRFRRLLPCIPGSDGEQLIDYMERIEAAERN